MPRRCGSRRDCGGRLVHTGTWTAPGEAVPRACRWPTRPDLARARDFPASCGRRREPVVIEDLWNDPRFLRPEAARDRRPPHRRGLPRPARRHAARRLRAFLPERRPVPPELARRPGPRRPSDRSVPRPAARRVRVAGSSPTRCSAACCPRTCPAVPGVELAARYRAGAAGSASSAATPTTSCRCPAAGGWCSSPTCAAPAPRPRRSPR